MRFWERPKKEIVKEIEFDENGNPLTRLRIRLFIKGGEIYNYTVQLEHSLKEEWKQIIRFNCFHGFAHKDVYNIAGEQIDKIDLGTFDNLKDAVSLAIKDINDNHKEYVRRFRKGEVD